MFTDCPACSRQFRIRASQLATAEGLVQCGFCGRQFNALERLYDTPLPVAAEPPEQLAREEIGEPDFHIPQVEATVIEKNEPQTTGTDEDDDFDIQLPDPEAERQAPGERNFTFEIADQALITPAAETTTESTLEKTPDPDTAAEYPFPEALASEEKPATSTLSKVFWSSGVIFLLLIAIVQAAWFQRDLLLSHYPELMPYARQLCAQLDCKLIRYRNISAIKLLNRDVRVHPRYEEALLVNATITNLSTYTQRFPTIMLSLFDNNGEVIAYRQIPPADYLDSSIDEEAGMAFDSPIHVVFEVANASTDAVSFEFDFL